MGMPVENTATILEAENEPSASVASRLERSDMRAVSDLCIVSQIATITGSASIRSREHR